MSARRLLIVSNFSEIGRGTYAVSRSLLDLEGFEVRAFDVYAGRLLPGPPGTAVALARLAWRLIWFRPAVLLADTQIGIILAWLATRVFRRAVFVARVGGMFLETAPPGRPLSGLRTRLWSAAVAGAERIIVPSRPAAARLRARFPHARVDVIANGLAPVTGPPVSFAAERPVRCLFVGRLDANKSADIAIRALDVMRGGHGLDAGLQVFGAGEEEAALKELARRKGLEAHVRFMGFDPQPWREVSENAILIHPAAHDGFGYAVLEAVQRGVPAIVRQGVGGPEDTLELTGGGRVVEATPEAFAEAVAELMADPEALAATMRSARDRANRLFSFERMLSDYALRLGAAADRRPDGDLAAPKIGART